MSSDNTSHKQYTVLLSSAMNSPEMLGLRTEIIKLFADDSALSIYYLWHVEGVASAASPPPNTALISQESGILLLLPDSNVRENVRAEIIEAKARGCKFFIFFGGSRWLDQDIKVFLSEMDLEGPQYTRFNTKDITSKVRNTFLDYAVDAIRCWQPYPADDLLVGADARWRQGKNAEALRIIDQVLDSEPAHFMAHSLRGFILHHCFDKPDEAIKEFQICLRLKPDDLNSAFNMAVSLSKSDEPKRAVSFYDRTENLLSNIALSLDSEILRAKLHLFRAVTRSEYGKEPSDQHPIKKDFATSQALLQKLLEANPGDKRIRHWWQRLPEIGQRIQDNIGSTCLLRNELARLSAEPGGDEGQGPYDGSSVPPELDSGLYDDASGTHLVI